MSAAATELQRRNSFERSGSGAGSSSSGEQSLQGIGLCGFGDERYPISEKLLDQCSGQTGFIRNLSNQWKSSHSEVVGAVAVEPPKVKPHIPCRDGFCTQTGRYGLDPLLVNSSQNLLRNICRSMKPLYREIKKQITSSARHPLLLARWCSRDGQTRDTVGWIVTFASFKPLWVAGIGVSLSKCIARESQVCLQSFKVRGSDHDMCNFASFDSIVAAIAELLPNAADEGGRVQYCFNTPYKLQTHMPMTHLLLTEDPRWVDLALTANAGDDSDGSAGDGDNLGGGNDMSDISDITSMVNNLTGANLSMDGKSSKRKTTKGTNSGGDSGNAAANCKRHLDKIAMLFVQQFPFAQPNHSTDHISSPYLCQESLSLSH